MPETVGFDAGPSAAVPSSGDQNDSLAFMVFLSGFLTNSPEEAGRQGRCPHSLPPSVCSKGDVHTASLPVCAAKGTATNQRRGGREGGKLTINWAFNEASILDNIFTSTFHYSQQPRYRIKPRKQAKKTEYIETQHIIQASKGQHQVIWEQRG